MRTIDRLRYVPHDWDLVAEVVGGAPDVWLPQPLVMAGSHEFSGHLRVFGAQVRVDYEVFDPWRDGAELSRRVHVVPRYGLYAGFEGDLVVRPEGEQLTQVRFVGQRRSAGSVWARPLGPLTATLLVTRFTDEVVETLDETAEEDDVSRFDEGSGV